MTECRNSKECHGPKHHYDECVERVTGQIDNDGKATEDCVEECMSSHGRYACAEKLTQFSLPPCSLRDPVRRTQALRSPQVNLPVSRPRRPLPRRIHDSIVGRWPLDRRTRQDTSRMTVNTRVMFRITLYYLPRQAISLPQTLFLMHDRLDRRHHFNAIPLSHIDKKERTPCIGLRGIVILQ